MTHATATARWPQPAPDRTEVMLLGTYHMANPGNDAVNLEADDVLAPDRQAELETLADCLEQWAPDRVAAEWPSDRQADLDALYDAYRGAGGDADLLEDHRRNEVVQVCCRLADRLGHDRVVAADSKVRPDERFDDPPEADLRAEMERADRELDAYDADLAAAREAEQRRLAASTIPEFLHGENREHRLHANDGMFAAMVSYGDRGEYAGAKSLGLWYERNLRIVQHLWWAAEAGADRVLLVVGSGHVRVLRHLLNHTPMLCPVSPLPYLPEPSG